MSEKSLLAIVFLFALQLLIAVYAPINNVVEYWTNEAEQLSMHFYIFIFAAISFYILFGQHVWNKLSHSGRNMVIIALIGWTMNLYLISVNPYLNDIESSEPYGVGAMIIIGPCLILLLDRQVSKIREKAPNK